MIKVYCDRCGKKLNTNDLHYYPLGDAANGDDIFFTVSVYNKAAKRTYDPRNKEVRAVDDPPNFVYDYNAPDLCIECMREINKAVKTVWDGKRPKTLGDIYGMIDDEKDKPKTCVRCKYHYTTMDEDPCKLCGPNHANWEPKDA